MICSVCWKIKLVCSSLSVVDGQNIFKHKIVISGKMAGGYFKELVTVYSTTRLVKIKSPFIAILYWLLVILVFCSFLKSLNLDIRRTYQTTCPVHGVVISKVKGHVSTQDLTDEDLAMDNPQLYKRIWDQADIVYPPQGGEGETGSFTVVTNLVITPNQTLSYCAENVDPDGWYLNTNCTEDKDCVKGYWSRFTNGVYTGKCDQVTSTCEIHGWCPVERNVLPRQGKKPLLEQVKDFTILLKSTVEFPECPGQQSRSLNTNTIFRIGDIVSRSGDVFSRVAIKGGVFSIKVNWDCDFDFGKTIEDCKPKYEFTRVDGDGDKKNAELGWNFRSAVFYEDNRRTLKKQYALKILIKLKGQGRKFDFFQLVITLGATIGLFSVAPLACDFLLDVFNVIGNSRKCGKCFSACHDAAASRYDKNSANVKSNKIRKLSFQGITNPNMTTSIISLNNECSKNETECPETGKN